MSIDLEKIVNDGINYLSQSEDLTEEEIDSYTYKKLKLIIPILYDGNALTEEELKQVNTRIKKRISHRIYNTNSKLIGHDYETWFKKRKNNLNMKYWKRYKLYLEKEKHFNGKITDNIDDVIDEILDLVGDPTVENQFQRRGLIIGDVQSGKTSNFIGLMCKACDAGYKLIVVLAGTSDVLRKQTQSRVDEGLIGVDSDNRLLKKEESVRIGAALYGDNDFAPVCVTSITKDFNKQIANSMGLKLNQTKDAIIFVIKKNVSVLNNLNSWIKSLNQTNENGVIDSSLLVIDDEADYASINTNSEDKDPTKTNARISELLAMFKKTSYVGFTATPYANVFIDPSIDDLSNGKVPLFPKDYIYCLDAPTNYIGARNLFGDDFSSDTVFKDIIETIETSEKFDDNEQAIYNILPLKHKKEASFDEVPYSLKKAIQEFFIVNAIRDLRGDVKSHRSMLINISRFVMVHEKIKKTVKKYVDSLNKSIVYCGKLDDKYSDENMQQLKCTYERQFKKCCEDDGYLKKRVYPKITWEMIKAHLYDSTSSIVVRIVNQKSKDEMDYIKNKENGLRVIAIGGIALSRGLTLEGLMISYFYRNSQCYDTLMQMGRWFGYRDGYDDLCRIWMTDDMQENYISINRATEELRESIIQYKDSGLTPLDFGIKVRTDSNLLITQRNKMRTAKEELLECSLSSTVIETPYLYNKKSILKENYQQTLNFIDSLCKETIFIDKSAVGTAKGFMNVNSSLIINFIQNIKVPFANIEFENKAIIKFISSNQEKLSNWDIALVQGNGRQYKLRNGINIKLIKRKIDIKPGTDLVRISGKNRRVGTPADGRFGLTKVEADIIKNNPRLGTKSVSQKSYFATINRRPLLCIYCIQCELKNDKSISEKRLEKAKSIVDFSEQIPIVALSIGIPNLGKRETLVKYALNKIEQGLKDRKFDLDDEAIDDE